jgi:hypothetical protein
VSRRPLISIHILASNLVVSLTLCLSPLSVDGLLLSTCTPRESVGGPVSARIPGIAARDSILGQRSATVGARSLLFGIEEIRDFPVWGHQRSHTQWAARCAVSVDLPRCREAWPTASRSLLSPRAPLTGGQPSVDGPTRANRREGRQEFGIQIVGLPL